MPIVILILSLFLMLKTNMPLSVTITTTAISFALSYIILIFSSIITVILTLFLPDNFVYTYTRFIRCIFQLLIMPIPFLFKRTKNGMPFLSKKMYAIPGLIISLFILGISVALNGLNYNPTYYYIPYVFLFILTILIYIYWRQHLTKTYIDKLNIQNIKSLNAELLEKEQYIEKLKQDNQQLAKIIHKDNKLIPAMEYAVETYLSENDLSLESSQRGMALLADIKELAKDRKGMLISQDRQCNKPPVCGVNRIDHLFQYIQQKAFEEGITFRVTLGCDLSEMTQKVIDEDALCTLLGDLLDNAVIATKYNGGKYILLSISMLGKHFSFHVFDSGIPFTKEVLAALGQQQITTHADDSGSGIGLMQTYEILKAHNASLLIDEFTTDSGLYTKKISVVFNRQNQYTLYTTRDEETVALLNHRSDLVVIRK
jgi:signal transduction histidine kinase